MSDFISLLLSLCMLTGAPNIPRMVPAAPRATLQACLSGAVAPLALTLGELTSEWRRINLATTPEPPDNMLLLAFITHGSQGRLTNFDAGTIYTRGQLVTIEDDTYLIGYRRQPARLAAPDEDAAPAALTAQTPLALALIKYVAGASLLNVRAFDLQREIAEHAPPPASSPMPTGKSSR